MITPKLQVGVFLLLLDIRLRRRVLIFVYFVTKLSFYHFVYSVDFFLKEFGNHVFNTSLLFDCLIL